MGFESEGMHVESISVFANWLKDVLGVNDNLVLGIFPGSSPKDGIAYESGEGDLFLNKMEGIANASDIWYLTLDIFHIKSPDSMSAAVISGFMSELGASAVTREFSCLRLLPFKSDSESIEFLSPPFNFVKVEKGEVQVDSFEMVNRLYQQYLDVYK